MKRIPALKSLSIDHHHGLVLANKAKKIVARNVPEDEQQAIWMALCAHADDVLISHFEIEESYIATALSAQNDPHLTQLVDRLYSEHAELRRLLSKNNTRNMANLKRLGELLEKHIRFEERELFEAVQTTLDQHTLQAIAVACNKRQH